MPVATAEMLPQAGMDTGEPRRPARGPASLRRPGSGPGTRTVSDEGIGAPTSHPRRALTRAEALLVEELLAGGREGSLTKELPRRTRQDARQRLYRRGWLADRYVPDLGGLGRPVVGFALARPFLDSQRDLARQWAARSETVLLWASPSCLFGVFALEDLDGLSELRADIGPPEAYQTEFWISANPAQPSIPVYFDFEGLWSRFAGLPGPRAYPQPLPGGSSPPGEEGRVPSSSKAAALRWVRRPFLPDPLYHTDGRRGGILTGIADRRCLREGRVRFRSFLRPASVAEWVSGFPLQSVFVHGARRDGASPERLFHALVGACDVHPFLFVAGREEVLLGLLGAGGADRDRPRNPASTAPEIVLERFLSRISILREPFEGLEALVDHRYDRPFESPS